MMNFHEQLWQNIFFMRYMKSVIKKQFIIAILLFGGCAAHWDLTWLETQKIVFSHEEGMDDLSPPPV